MRSQIFKDPCTRPYYESVCFRSVIQHQQTNMGPYCTLLSYESLKNIHRLSEVIFSQKPAICEYTLRINKCICSAMYVIPLTKQNIYMFILNGYFVKSLWTPIMILFVRPVSLGVIQLHARITATQHLYLKYRTFFYCVHLPEKYTTISLFLQHNPRDHCALCDRSQVRNL